MTLVSERYWPHCPKHFTWMQPVLRPRHWRCNVRCEGSRGLDGQLACPEFKRYRWWRMIDRRAFAILEVNEQTNLHQYYCPLCESFFSPDRSLEARYSPPYFRLCSKCMQMGIEHHTRYARCASCGGDVRFSAGSQSERSLRWVDGAYCRTCSQFFCSGKCEFHHSCKLQRLGEN
jgi:hypothetical protein